MHKCAVSLAPHIPLPDPEASPERPRRGPEGQRSQQARRRATSPGRLGPAAEALPAPMAGESVIRVGNGLFWLRHAKRPRECLGNLAGRSERIRL